ncbi:MAG: hypothetical protein KGJ60_07910, partial [Verrucomicrobiota bacterium]|nr:hypothetical protein [Verrucomicrobiota bacterium]
MAASAPAAVTVSPGEMVQQDAWVRQHLLSTNHLPPFSFTYDGQPSSALLPAWKRTESDTTLDA